MYSFIEEIYFVVRDDLVGQTVNLSPQLQVVMIDVIDILTLGIFLGFVYFLWWFWKIMIFRIGLGR